MKKVLIWVLVSVWLELERLSTLHARLGAKRNAEKLNMLRVVSCLEVLH
jgi:hypothetical protein